MTIHRFAIAVAGLTFVLLVAGGLVSATESGLACPDWPTCHGTFLPALVGGVRFEHTHRLVASTVGLCTVILALLLWRRRVADRRLVRLGFAAVALVVFQGLLGGATVLLKLPPAVSIAHLATSMVFFSLTVALAFATRPAEPPESASAFDALRPALWLVAAATYVQIVLGAVVRHTRSGLACVELPLCRGALFPADGHLGVQIHMAHRVFGAVVLVAIAAAAAAAFRAIPTAADPRRPRRGPGDRRGLRALALAVPVVALGQVALGAAIVLTWRDLFVMTAHQATGALLLALCVSLALRARGRTTPGLARAEATSPAVPETATAAPIAGEARA